MIRQTVPYGCGMYAVANALNFSDFVTDKRLEESRKGNTIWQLNKWLEEDGHHICVDPMYQDTRGTKLPDHWIDNWNVENPAIGFPLLLEVLITEKSLSHLVAAKAIGVNTIIVMDSLSGGHSVMPFHTLNEKYNKVTGIYGFQSTENNNWITWIMPDETNELFKADI